MKSIFCFIVFYVLPIYGNADSLPDKPTSCYQSFQNKHYSLEAMGEHLHIIGRGNHTAPFSKTFAKLLGGKKTDFSSDPAFQGSVIGILGDINRQKKAAVISKLLKRLHNNRTHYLERKQVIQTLGYLLKPGNTKDIKQLSRNLQDRSSEIRKETVLALKNIRPEHLPKIEHQLVKMAFNENEEMSIRIAAIDALGEILSHNQERRFLDIGPLRFSRNDYRKKTVFRMAEGLISPESDIRKATASALKKIKLKEWTLIQQLKVQELYQQQWETEIRTSYNHPEPFGSWYEVDIFLAIHQKGYFIVPDFEVSAGTELSNSSWNLPYRIDFVVFGSDGRKLAIEYDGAKWHVTEEAMQKDMGIQEDLESFGWEVFRISEKDFKVFPEDALEGLWSKLNEIQIHPMEPSKSFWEDNWLKSMIFRGLKKVSFQEGEQSNNGDFQ